MQGRNKKVFVSTACLDNNKICDSVSMLAMRGVSNIELSGGTRFYDGFEKDLLILKAAYNIAFRIHGYFPPPEADFVLNLAAIDDALRHKSISLVECAVKLAGLLGAQMYSSHSGFTVDILPILQGRRLIISDAVKDKALGREMFYKSLDFIMRRIVAPDFKFAIENAYPLMGRPDFVILSSPAEITGFLDYARDYPNLGLLLDLGHLNLSARVFGYDKVAFLKKILREYKDKIYEIHLSENDGSDDTHDITEDGSWQSEVANWDEIWDVPVVFEWRKVALDDIVARYKRMLNNPVLAGKR